ncbi:unnamed protein product [Dimorphilus gyrociliatus]|uniref:E3 ubiquitin-protein ligase n=1 Tax=Dimorphilus gyrociliatus TaxID=2664684 RepID=A0A7I8V8I6_9ANNE|nr:unnamed protein product [Dimorphilus gyrociliatus]
MSENSRAKCSARSGPTVGAEVEKKVLEENKTRILSEHEECSVCLQSCIHPVLLPCNHIFCFLCIKGAAQRDRRCALCRTEIPNEFFKNPNLVPVIDKKTESRKESSHRWFYEGRGGWWQYDERSNKDIEDRYIKKEYKFEVQIAGSLYVIDLENYQQINRNDPSRRRKIKRDVSPPDLKGIAGLKISSESRNRSQICDREGADGGSAEETPTRTSTSTRTTSTRTSTRASETSTVDVLSESSTAAGGRREADGTD